MATIGQLISDIELRLSKGDISDDFPVDRRQIQFWLDSIRAQLMKEKEDTLGNAELADFIVIYECLPILKRVKECGGDCDGTEYEIILPVSVADVKNDLGVYRVETEGGQTIFRVRASEKARIYQRKFAKPNRSRAVWYRHQLREVVEGEDTYKTINKLVILGGSDNFKNNGKVNLWLIPEDTSDLDEESDYPIDSSLVAELLDRVEAIGRREMQMQEDLENDGKQ